MRWFYLAIVVVFVAALIIFVFQNTESVSISFLSFGVTCRSLCWFSSSMCSGR